jgi:hypothetical protein
MTKLNQILAIEKDVRAAAQRGFDQAAGDISKGSPLNGVSRTYQPRAEDGDQLPPESTRVQVTVDDANTRLAKALARLWDITATKDWANTQARADIVVDGETILADAPGTFLIWFEKQLDALRGYLTKLPVLDPAEEWRYDQVSAAYRSEPAKTVRSRKVPQNHLIHPATVEHPAQVQVFTVDEAVGEWTTTKFSGAIPEARRIELLERVDRLARAVKFAREEANQQTVTDVEVGANVFGYLFA